MSATYSNGRAARLGDKVISAGGLNHALPVIDVMTNKVGALGYWESVGTVTDIFPDGTVRVLREEVGFGDAVGFTYDVAAKHVLVGGDS